MQHKTMGTPAGEAQAVAAGCAAQLQASPWPAARAQNLSLDLAPLVLSTLGLLGPLGLLCARAAKERTW